MTEIIKKPEKIYLQHHDLDSDWNETDWDKDLDCITWSLERINEDDLKYFPSEIVELLNKKLEVYSKALTLIAAQCGIDSAGDACRAILDTCKRAKDEVYGVKYGGYWEVESEGQ